MSDFNWTAFHALWISIFLIRWIVKWLFKIRLEVIIGTLLYGFILVAIKFYKYCVKTAKRIAGFRVHVPEVKRNPPPASVLDFNIAYRLTKTIVVIGHNGRRIAIDLNEAHMLIAGTTGSGKTVCINGILIQLVTRPEYGNEYDIYMIDLKADDQDMLHMWAPVIAGYYAIDQNGSTEQAIVAIEDILNKMAESDGKRKIIVFIDELAMLTDQAPSRELRDRGKAALMRLSAQLRSKGALIVATQRPHFETIPRNISANLERKVCFRVDDAETAQLVLRSNKKPKEDFSSFPTGQFMMKYGGKVAIGRTTMVSDDDIAEAIGQRIDLDAESDIRLKLFKFVADGLQMYAQVPGINRVTPQFEGLNSKQVEGYYRNYVQAGALEPIVATSGKSRGNKLAASYTEAVARIKDYIQQGEWQENPPPIKK